MCIALRARQALSDGVEGCFYPGIYNREIRFHRPHDRDARLTTLYRRV